MKLLRMLFPLLALSLLVLPAASAQDAPDPELRQASMRLLEVTGASEMGAQMGMMMAQQMLADRESELTPAQRQIILEELQSFFDERFGEAMKEIAAVYEKHLTLDEMQQLIDFYESPVGRKTIRVMPQILQESMAIGQRWGASLGPEIARRVEERLQESSAGDDS